MAITTEARLRIQRTMRELLPPGDSVHIVQTRRTECTRKVKVLVAVEAGEVRDVTQAVSQLTGMSMDRHGNLSVKGSGFSAAQHVAASLSHALWGDSTSLRYTE